MPAIEIKGSTYYIYDIADLDQPIKIPSAMFPVPGKLKCINNTNTYPFPNDERTEKIKSIYNSIAYQPGFCYNNIKMLLNALKKENIIATPFVGWYFVGSALPVHHCFAMVDNKYILDFSPRIELLLDSESMESDDIDYVRNRLVNRMIELSKIKNHESTTFGQMSPYACAFVSRMDPDEGIRIYQKLKQSYPKHICDRNLIDGMNATQRMYYSKKGKEK